MLEFLQQLKYSFSILTGCFMKYFLPFVYSTRDPVQLNLLYEQAKEAILDGTHPVPLETAIQFGALQVQIQFGDHKEDKHKPGMLAE